MELARIERVHRFTKFSSLVLIRLVLTEIQPFKNVKIGHPDAVFRQRPDGHIFNRQPVSSVGRATDCCAGGRRFKPRPDQHSGSLNN